MEASLGGLMTKEEAAEYGGVSATMVNEAARRGRIPFERRYGKLWFLARDIDDWKEKYDPQVQGISQVRIFGHVCRNCKKSLKIYATFLCKNCYNYRQRTGNDRPVPPTKEELLAQLKASPEGSPVNCRDTSVWDEYDQEWVTEKYASEIAGVSRGAVRQVVNSGKMISQKFGTDKAARVLRSEVEARWKK